MEYSRQEQKLVEKVFENPKVLSHILDEEKFYYVCFQNYLSAHLAYIPRKEDEKPLQKTRFHELGTFLAKVIEHIELRFQLMPSHVVPTADLINKVMSPLLDFEDEVEGRIFLHVITGLMSASYSKRGKEKIHNYLEFIKMCADHPKYCALKNLYSFSLMINEPLVGYKVEATDVRIRTFDGVVNSEDMFKAFKELKATPIYKFKPTGYEQTKQYFHQVMFKNGYMETLTYHVYELRTIRDFLSAALQEIFRHSKQIKYCGNEDCGQYFVPLNYNEKYCNNISPKNPNKTCKEYMRLFNQQRSEKSSELKILQKRVRNMLHQRAFTYGNFSADEYQNFLDTCDDFRKKIFDGEKTEADYINYLKDFYGDKYKSKKA